MEKGKGPGHHHRKGLTIVELMQMFPDEASAVRWFEEQVWGETGRCCGHCGSVETSDVPNGKPMPYWCRDCRSYFSVRTGTPLQNSNVPMRKWAIAVYLCATNIKGVSSMKLHRDLGVSQKTAWFMLHRLRKAWETERKENYKGPVEVDEVYIGGLEKNKHRKNRLRAGRGGVGKTAVMGVLDRDSKQVSAQPVVSVNGKTAQGMIMGSVRYGAKVYTDDSTIYKRVRNHSSVNHSGGEYVRGDVHINSIESFWSLFKRGFHGTYHKMSPKHLHRYVNEFAGRHNIRDQDTIDQMHEWVANLIGKQLLYRELIKDNGLPSGARG